MRPGEFSEDQKGRMFLSLQTYEGLKITAYSHVETIWFLLEQGFQYVLSERFMQDVLEDYFGHQRSKGGRSDNPTAQQFGYNDLTKDLADQIQMDLVDMGKYKKQNKGYYWILTAIEILSRYAFTIPVYRKDTKNMTKAVSDLLEEFKERFGKYPNVAQFDEGKEFYNVGVRDLLTKNNIEYFSTNSERKAAIIERFNRTLKTSMWKYFYSKRTHTWIDILDDLTDNYNHSKHRTIMMRPADVNQSNKDQVWITLYGYIQGDFPIPKFKVDDTVRVSKYKNIFDKGYESNFTEEIFKIAKVFRGDPNMYELVDVDDEPIIGKFYEEELSAINKTDDVYHVEKILRRRKGQALVKWAGYDSKHNSWISIKDIQSLKYNGRH